MALTANQAKIAAVLDADQWKDVEGIADETGLSARSVSASLRHMQGLLKRGRPGWSAIAEYRLAPVSDGENGEGQTDA